jgi:hypothetical protein
VQGVFGDGLKTNKPALHRSLKSDLARVDAHMVQTEEYRDLPTLTNEMLARATVNNGCLPAPAKPNKLISLWLPVDGIERLEKSVGANRRVWVKG